MPLTVSLPPGITDVSLDCSVGNVRAFANSGPAVLNLKPGTYVLGFRAMRKFSARVYSKQRYFPTTSVALYRGLVSTKRTFDPSTGVNTTTSPNAFTTQVFGNGSITIAPVDRWTLDLPQSENPSFTSVSPADIVELMAVNSTMRSSRSSTPCSIEASGRGTG
jgi:hypothetical protein